jgi:hypothetical protein
MSPMTQAVLKAGIITPNMLREIKRFSVTLDPDAQVESPKELEHAAQIIATAMEEAGYTTVRETDLDVLRQYMETATDGTLHLEAGEEPMSIEVTYGKTKTGEYIIAWNSESIEDSLTNGMTHLIVWTGKYEKVFFQDVRELWYGEKKAFMVCVPRESDVHGG